MNLLKSIEEQKSGRDLFSGVLLTVCLGGVALMVSIFPEGKLPESVMNIYWGSVTLLAIATFTSLISLLRKMAEAELMQDIHRIPNIHETLERMRSDPNVRVQQSKRGDMLAFRMRLITWAFRVSILAFLFWLVSLGIFGYVSFQ